MYTPRNRLCDFEKRVLLVVPATLRKGCTHHASLDVHAVVGTFVLVVGDGSVVKLSKTGGGQC